MFKLYTKLYMLAIALLRDQKIKLPSRTFLLILAISIASFLTRTYMIDAIPAVISHDEMYYANEAQTVSLSGSDLSGQWRPWHLVPSHPLFAELPGTLASMGFLLLPSSPFLATKLVYILAGTMLPLILAGIVYELTKHRPTALITFILASVNPWLFQFSRMGFDSLLSLFFYFLALYTFLSFTDWKKYVVTFSLLVMGFFQYQGLKVIFPPLVLILTLYQVLATFQESWLVTLRKNLHSLAFLAFCALFVIAYFSRLPANSESRLQDMIFFNDEYVTAQVNLKRQQGLANPFQIYFVNKGTVITEELIYRYLQSFNPTQLFIKGEPLRNPFSVWDYGIFHPIDFFLLLMGLVTIWQLLRGKEIGWLLIALILIAPLPSAINIKDTWIMFRSSFLFPLLILLISIGFSKLWHWLPKTGRVLLLIGYGLWVMSFFYQYFYRYPLYGTRGNYFAERVITSYASRINDTHSVAILGDESRFLWEAYLFYSRSITPENLSLINLATRNEEYQLHKVRIATDCIDQADLDAGQVIIAGNSVSFCENGSVYQPGKDRVSVPSLLDSGTIFTIYNDPLCRQQGLDTFAHVDQNIFAVEKLTDTQFCQAFFVQN